MAVSSGATAVSMSLLNLLSSAGDNFVSVPMLYGATYTYFAHVLPRLGIEVRFSADDRPESIAARIDERTKAVFCETVGNPAGNVIDLAAVAEVAHARGVPDHRGQHGGDAVLAQAVRSRGRRRDPLADEVHRRPRHDARRHHHRRGHVPVGRPPGALRADGRAGACVSRRSLRDRLPRRRPTSTRCRTVGLRNTGAALSPFNAFLLLQGLETLAVRLPRHESNTRAVAEFLAADPRVTSVSFVGFPDNPYYELAERYLGGHAPSIMTFTVQGGRDAGIAMFNNVKLFKRLLNMGDAKSLITHPASTTHRQLTPEDLKLAGITPDMVRLSVGLEHPDDLIEDLDQALAAAASA